ncbi:PqiC family protein [Pseudoalteromonas piscicida]|uniref:PqiC family protein n=1 Tax=Pseudoalteromonas piscicida TaxID=43662 RepID=UPI0030A7E975
MIVRFATLALLLLLSGCVTNSPQPINYYQLNQEQVAKQTQEVANNEIVLVDKVQLTELFNQQALVQFQPNNQVHIANFHLWAQPPSDMLTWNLINTVNAKSRTTAIKSDKFYRNNQAHQRLVVEVNEFAGHYEKGAILSGTWYLYSYQTGNYQLTKVQPFHFESALEQDGFSALVSAHQKNFTQLSTQIAQQL